MNSTFPLSEIIYTSIVIYISFLSKCSPGNFPKYFHIHEFMIEITRKIRVFCLTLPLCFFRRTVTMRSFIVEKVSFFPQCPPLKKSLSVLNPEVQAKSTQPSYSLFFSILFTIPILTGQSGKKYEKGRECGNAGGVSEVPHFREFMRFRVFHIPAFYSRFRIQMFRKRTGLP